MTCAPRDKPPDARRYSGSERQKQIKGRELGRSIAAGRRYEKGKKDSRRERDNQSERKKDVLRRCCLDKAS